MTARVGVYLYLFQRISVRIPNANKTLWKLNADQDLPVPGDFLNK